MQESPDQQRHLGNAGTAHAIPPSGRRGWRAGFIDATLGFVSRSVETSATRWPAEIFLSASGPMMFGARAPVGLITRSACSFQSIDAEILAGTPNTSCRILTVPTASSAELYGRPLMPLTGGPLICPELVLPRRRCGRQSWNAADHRCLGPAPRRRLAGGVPPEQQVPRSSAEPARHGEFSVYTIEPRQASISHFWRQIGSCLTRQFMHLPRDRGTSCERAAFAGRGRAHDCRAGCLQRQPGSCA